MGSDCWGCDCWGWGVSVKGVIIGVASVRM